MEKVVTMKYGSGWGDWTWTSQEVVMAYGIRLWKGIKKGWEDFVSYCNIRLYGMPNFDSEANVLRWSLDASGSFHVKFFFINPWLEEMLLFLGRPFGGLLVPQAGLFCVLCGPRQF